MNRINLVDLFGAPKTSFGPLQNITLDLPLVMVLNTRNAHARTDSGGRSLAGGGGDIRAIPPGQIIRGQHIFSPQAKTGHMDPFGPQSEVDYLQVSPFQCAQPQAERPRTQQDESGPRGMNRGPAGRIRTPREKLEPRKMNQGPAGRISNPQSGPLGTNHGPAGRIRVPRDAGLLGSRASWKQGFQEDESGPAGRIRTPQDESGPRVMKQGSE